MAIFRCSEGHFGLPEGVSVLRDFWIYSRIANKKRTIPKHRKLKNAEKSVGILSIQSFASRCQKRAMEVHFISVERKLAKQKGVSEIDQKSSVEDGLGSNKHSLENGSEEQESSSIVNRVSKGHTLRHVIHANLFYYYY